MRELIQRLLDAEDQPRTVSEDVWMAVGYLLALRDYVEDHEGDTR